MLLREAPRRLEGRVGIDDAYLGGERAGTHPWRAGACKQIGLRRRRANQRVRQTALHVPDAHRRFYQSSDQGWAATHLMPTAHVVCDGLQCLKPVSSLAATHQRYVTGGGRQAPQTPQLRWVNTVPGSLKTALAGTYHSFDHAKYGARYPAEFAYRFNRRFDLPAMVPRLLWAAAAIKPQPLKILRWSEAGK